VTLWHVDNEQRLINGDTGREATPTGKESRGEIEGNLV
jgi:hypothetical protein